MNWKRNPQLLMGMSVALGVALLIIFVLIMRSKQKPQQESYPPRPALRQPQPHAEGAQPQPSATQTPGAAGQPPVPPQKKAALVLFFAEWCGHCKHMKPDWEKVTQALAQHPQIQTIALEHKQHSEIMKAQGIQGFPVIRLYPEGFPGEKYAEYQGDRSADSIMKFVQSGGQSS